MYDFVDDTEDEELFDDADYLPPSLCSLPSIVFSIEYLAVLHDGATSISLGGDVVALHELEVVFFAAEGTDVVLPLPCRQLDFVGIGAEGEIFEEVTFVGIITVAEHHLVAEMWPVVL